MIGQLRPALDSPPDFSEHFEDRVARLGDRLGEALGAAVEHDRDMNYSSGQRLIAWFGEDGEPLPPHSEGARDQLCIYVSSRGPYFTIRPYHLTPAGPEMGLPPGVEAAWVARDRESAGPLAGPALVARGVLEREGFRPVEGAILDRVVDGSVTQLDGKPATVFEVLFSEI